MTTKLLYDYLMKHAYSSFAGWMGLASGLLIASLYFIEGRFAGNILALIAGLVVILYAPVSLYSKAHRQMLLNPSFKNPIHYEVDAEGITVVQGEASQKVGWADISKVRSTKKSILVYTSPYTAWIFPRQDLGENLSRLLAMIESHIDTRKIKLGKKQPPSDETGVKNQ